MDQQALREKDSFVLLPDGRRLGYAEYGAPEGRPVLFFHGMPGSAYIDAAMADVAARHDVRLIAVDRPGYGLSDPQPGRTLLGWADDIAELTAVLGISKYSIVGFSGGSPYALACAYRHPAHLDKLALVGPFSPLDVPGATTDMSPSTIGLFALAKTAPEELKKAIAPLFESPSVMLTALSASLPEWDKKVVDQRREEFEAEYERALIGGGVDGVVSDFVLAAIDWGFNVEDISTETHLWSGTDDCNTPPAMMHYLASKLPNNQTFILPGEGHLSLYVHWEEILERLG